MQAITDPTSPEFRRRRLAYRAMVRDAVAKWKWPTDDIVNVRLSQPRPPPRLHEESRTAFSSLLWH